MTEKNILKEATFSPSVVRYWSTAAVVGLAVSIIGIPLIPIVLPITVWYWRKQYARMRVILTSRDLEVHRGVLNREEKAIPLEKITDLAVYDGPIMRRFGLRGIRVETAGQSSGGAALVTVVGIEGTDGFRDLVLRQRDRIAERHGEPNEGSPAGAAGTGTGGDAEVVAALRGIHETLRRIESALAR